MSDEAGFVTQLRPGVAQPKANAGWVLIVTEGPDKGLRLTMDARARPHALVGQSPVCDLQLTDRCVSRRHVALDATDTLRLTDLRSTNGTTVNGVSVGRAFLRGGETIRIGDTEIRLHTGPKLAEVTPVDATSFGGVLGGSAPMRRLYPIMQKLAAADVPVVIEGETGTGKEVLAEAIHAASARGKGPFVIFDCTTVPSTLFEAELFGYERGAFTGAVQSRKGMFEEADGGTLLIDEIGDLDLAVQAKLLRALDTREVRRVGGNRLVRVDVRVLAATRRDLDRMVQENRFRDDLFFRLAVGRIELPPLRERAGDVTVLARTFWQKLGGPAEGPSEDALRRWEDYDWPGNVRELHNAVLREFALGEDHEAPPRSARPIEQPSQPDVIADVIEGGIAFPLARKRVNEEFVHRYVEAVLARHGGNVSNAAAASGLARRYFQLLRSGKR